MKTNKKKLIKAIDIAVQALELKCGGVGGKPGPCPTGAAKPSGAAAKPATESRGKISIPKGKISEKEAKDLNQKISDVMKAANLHPYSDGTLRDNSIGGINTSASNTQNWKLIDGDNPSTSVRQSHVPKGHIEVGVSVKGAKVGIRYNSRRDEDGNEEGYSPQSMDVEKVGNNISAALTKAGVSVAKVTTAGYDSGYGTKNVNYAVLIKKPK